jgi:hypothetical protein
MADYTAYFCIVTYNGWWGHQPLKKLFFKLCTINCIIWFSFFKKVSKGPLYSVFRCIYTNNNTLKRDIYSFFIIILLLLSVANIYLIDGFNL